jgi:osmotically-inducible protein OsmY
LWLLICALALAGLAQSPVTPASWLQHAITLTLVQDPELNQYPLTVTVDPHLNVTLDGVVPSPQDKRKAEHLAHGVAGMNSLSNGIIVDGAVAQSISAAANPAALTALQTKIQTALGAQPALATVTAHVYPRVVTLTGPVADSQAKQQAGAVARQAAPGWKLVNAIGVAPSS